MSSSGRCLVLCLPLVALACATSGATPPTRGVISAGTAGISAVWAGAGVVRVYASGSHQTMFFARGGRGSGEDDCRAAQASGRLERTVVVAPEYHGVTVTVGEGEVLCLITTGNRNEELMWRARPLASR
jgi:hypothetical protein